MTTGADAEVAVIDQRVVIVYQDALLRDLVQHLIRSVEGMTVAHACHLEQFHPNVLTEHDPTVIIADRMPAEAVVSLLEAIGNKRPSTRVISVSLSRDELYVLAVSKYRPVGVEEFLHAVRGNERTSEPRMDGEQFSRPSSQQEEGIEHGSPDSFCHHPCAQ
jgi:DNA-binding NarL/FixJ family response regulator